MAKAKGERVESILQTIDDICRSPSVQHFMVGYTKRAMRKRSDEYSKYSWDGFVVLQDCLTREQALQLENELFSGISENPKTSIIYRKYDRDRRDGPYWKNDGGADQSDADEPIHKVYMIWTHVTDNYW